MEDKTNGQLLPAKREELVQWIESKAPKGASSRGTNNNNDEGTSTDVVSVIEKIKNAYKMLEAGTPYEPPSKKVKTSNTNNENNMNQASHTKNDNNDEKLFLKQIDLYNQYHKKYKNDDIKDILGYNRQYKTGTKDFLIMKLIDGTIYGRLGRCPICTAGRLKIKEDDCYTVTCAGTFDETMNVRMDCSFKCTTATAPRYQPWYVNMKIDSNMFRSACDISERTRQDADPIFFVMKRCS